MDLDYYEILEISRDADGATIKKAYRKLAMKFHPDQNQGDKQAEEQFKLINEAYQVLSDTQKRAIYDRHGKAGLQGQGFRQYSGQNYEDIMDDLGSIFESVFGSGFGGFSTQGRRQKSRKYTLDLETTLTLDFNEAIFGCTKEVAYRFKSPCATCDGTGSKDKKLSTCSECGGKGQIFFRQGFMTYSQTCGHCNGTGEAIKTPCPECSGKGFEEKEATITVDIPEGIDNGNRIRAAGKGNVDESGHKGDLYVHIRVKEDDHFVRHNDDIYIEVPVFFTQAVLGDTLTSPTLRGEKELKLPVGAKDKQQFLFEGEGVQNVHTRRKGNLVAQISLRYPKKLTDKQRELLQELQESFGYESTPHEKSFEGVFDKIKSWFS